MAFRSGTKELNFLVQSFFVLSKSLTISMFVFAQIYPFFFCTDLFKIRTLKIFPIRTIL